MAITTVGQPDDFAPGYNPVWWYFNSTNKNEPGFRYIVDLYVDGNFVTRSRIIPSPTDGLCEYNVNKILSSYLTNELPNYNSGAEPDNSYIEYELKVGEEYLIEWAYDDYEFYSAPGTPWNAYTKLRNFGTETHTFVANDKIQVDTSIPSLNGLHTVVAVPDAYTIVIDVLFIVPGSGPLTPGTVIFADNRKTIVAPFHTEDDQVVFNGAVSHETYRTYNADNLFGLTTSNLGQAVTTCPTTFTVRDSSRLVFNWFTDYSTTGHRYLYAQSDDGTTYRRSASNASVPMLGHGVGPGNMSAVSFISGVAPLIKPDTKWYKIWIADAAIDRTSQEYLFNIDRSCSKYIVYEAVFLDRLGSLGSFSFTYKNEESQSVNREDHKFILGARPPSSASKAWTYATTDAGSKIINVDATSEITMRTAWLSDAESLYFKELQSSPVVWLAKNGGDLFPAICLTNTIKIGRHPVDKRIQYELKFRMANNDIINW